MKRTIAVVLVIAFACGAGWGVSEWLYRSEQGRLLVADGIQRVAKLAEEFGWKPSGPAAGEFVVQENLRRLAGNVPIAASEIERELELLRLQFGDDQRFTAALNAGPSSPNTFRAYLTEHLQARRWLEEQTAPAPADMAAEARDFYQTNPAAFELPPRFRASHIFVAAPDGSPPEVIAAKQSAIQGLAVRLLSGEVFAEVAAQASEDEATKTRGGDLGFFSGWRMPPEFMAELEKLQVGQLSAPIRTHLGFHLVQLTEVRPARRLSFEEAEPEIMLALANARRAAAVAKLSSRLQTR